MTDLRPWQQNARRLVAETLRDVPPDKNTLLVEAGIGSGKTLAALIAALDAIESKQIARIIILTFTSHLVRQWGKAATLVGLKLLECRGGNGAMKDGFPADANGYVTTFAAVNNLCDMHEALATGRRTLVIIDEIHHLGEDHEEDFDIDNAMTKWAERAYTAFKNVVLILALSGTPYRTDKKFIPFVEYKEDAYRDMYLLKSDLQYSYGQSVFDGICRRVIFEQLDGPVELTISLEKNGVIEKVESQTVRFNDNIERERYHDRLVAALKIDNEYNPSKSKNQLLIDLIRKANNKLHDLRISNPRAGGLIIADNKDHARKLRVLLKQVTGYDAIVVLEDVTNASDLIDAYRDGDSPWIIAVNMIAEGIDIPRLRVCVYLSCKTAWLYVMQVIGRVVRDPPGQSYFYSYPDPRLMKIIKQIEEELEIWLRRKGRGPPPPPPEFTRIIELNNASGDQWSGLVAGEPVTAAEMHAVDSMRQSMPELTDADYLTLLQIARKTTATKQQHERTKATVPVNGMSYTEVRIDLRGRIQKAVGRINKLRPDLAHNDIHNQLNRQCGTRGKDAASIEQLEHMLALAQEWIATVERTNDHKEQSGSVG
jgi:superfamily II DNA or RNA helicase